MITADTMISVERAVIAMLITAFIGWAIGLGVGDWFWRDCVVREYTVEKLDERTGKMKLHWKCDGKLLIGE
jgi:hypothetical protein